MEDKIPSKKKGKGLPVRIKSKQIKEDLMYLRNSLSGYTHLYCKLPQNRSNNTQEKTKGFLKYESFRLGKGTRNLLTGTL